nr:integrase, catalytic region, zinc finger, CCHC-type, peptidase aspartic, catalytic [Tanacetum cinerariifolium]
MANLSEDIQCAGSDTQPPMLDRTDFASWKQHIRLYCRGKENGVNILKSIDKGPFEMGTVWEPVAEGTEGAPHLGRQNRGQGTNPWGEGAAGYREFRTELGMLIQVKQDRLSATTTKALMTQTMFMVNLSTADPVCDEAGLSYDSDILSEVHNHDHSQDAVCEPHDEHEMHDNVQLNHVVDTHADYTSKNNMIPYDQYVKDNAVPGVQSNVSSVPNDAYMMIYNDMYEPHDQCVSKTSWNTVVETSLTVELATYKEQVELYERRARFELTKREQKINE